MEPQRSGPFPYVPINRRPRLEWPGGANIAVWVVPNFEVFALNEKMPGAEDVIPNVPAWSLRDYGARIGACVAVEPHARRVANSGQHVGNRIRPHSVSLTVTVIKTLRRSGKTEPRALARADYRTPFN